MTGNISWNSVLRKDRPLIFSILNCTPDSFSDGGEFINEVDIQNKIVDLLDASDVIDVGAESTRPGAKEISAEEQIERLAPVFSVLNTKNLDVLFSIDTRSADVADTSIFNGFRIINDVSGGNFDENMLSTIASSNALCVLMHMRGLPENMKTLTSYDDLVSEVCAELELVLNRAINSGIDENKIMLDPGIGFAKTPEQCLELIKKIDLIKKNLGFPLLVGHSRKSFIPTVIEQLTNSDKRDDIEWATAFLSRYLADAGVDALRVHDHKNTLKALKNSENF